MAKASCWAGLLAFVFQVIYFTAWGNYLRVSLFQGQCCMLLLPVLMINLFRQFKAKFRFQLNLDKEILSG